MEYTITELQNLELCQEAAKAPQLLTLLDSADWLLTVKALITIGRLANAAVADNLIKWLKRQKTVYWQLQALDSWAQLPLAKAEQAETVSELFGWAKQPVTLRGLVVLSAAIGEGKIVEMLADFIEKPSHRLIKDEILAYAWFKAVKGQDQAYLDAVLLKRPNLRVWLKYQHFDGKAIYSVYPYPDYLWQEAQKRNLSRKDFKNLYWRPRKKQSRQI